MRKNCQAVMDAWNNNEKEGKPGSAIWTDGYHVYSYQTCVVAWNESGDPLDFAILNRTKYSVTTSGHQTAIAAYLAQHFGGAEVLEGLPFGVTPPEVIDSYHRKEG